MTTQPTTTPDTSKKNTTLFYLGSVLLIGNFLFRMLVMADEYPSRTVMYMQLAIDALLLAGLIGLRKNGPQWLFVIALIAGIGLFGIRLHSKHSWYTGHWHYIFDNR
jgi:hypothetical protein